jgi:hypothetical protein
MAMKKEAIAPQPLAPDTGGATSASSSPSIFTMTLTQATQAVEQATAAVTQIQGCLPGLVTLPAAERKTSVRLRPGEAQALLSVLTECAARPELVASLADLDNGVDPTTFEPDLISARLQLAQLLAPLSASLSQLASTLDDTILHLNGLTRRPTLKAYDILKAVAQSDTSVKTAITPALDFYANLTKASAASRKKNAAARLAAQLHDPATVLPSSTLQK